MHVDRHHCVCVCVCVCLFGCLLLLLWILSLLLTFRLAVPWYHLVVSKVSSTERNGYDFFFDR